MPPTIETEAESGIVMIRGKAYKTVALRVQEFRDQWLEHGIETKIISQADLVTVKATITNEQGRVVATGYAEEDRAFGNINKTSAVENCETSAVGRALAFFGLAGTEIASADELANALSQQEILERIEPILKHNIVLRQRYASVVAIKDALLEANYSTAKEAWQELTEDEQRGLWLAPSKGGIFTTSERNQMKSPDWHAAE